MTIYLTPYNPTTEKATGPSVDSGFPTIQDACDLLGDGWATAGQRTVLYPAQGLAVTDYVLRVEP